MHDAAVGARGEQRPAVGCPARRGRACPEDAAPMASLLNPPDVVQPDEPSHPYRPSWSDLRDYINEEHREIFERTEHLPGWARKADSEKLYEVAYRCGSVMLEIGVFGGRSAVVALRGALAGAEANGTPPPQFYGVDVAGGVMQRAAEVLRAEGLLGHALLFHGDLTRFARELPIRPTMVFVDADHSFEGVWSDLGLLLRLTGAGTPVICHDFGLEGVRRAVEAWIGRGEYELMGRFAGSALLRTVRGTGACGGRGLPAEVFERTRSALLERYSRVRLRGRYTPVGDVTAEARVLLTGRPRRGASGRAPWPYAPVEAPALPPTLPGGRPWPRISIVTASYNQGRFIEETILSVLHQGYPDVEHIIIDGGSTDGTIEILQRYADRLAFWVSEPDGGQSDAINKGLSRATGQILTWLNSDDMLAPGALAAAALAFELSRADMIAGEAHIQRDGRTMHRHLTSCGEGALPLEDLLDLEQCWQGGQFFYQPEVMFRRELFERAGGRVEVGAHWGMDYELWLRLAEHGARLHPIGRPMALFRAHDEQKTVDREGFVAELVQLRAAFLERTGALASAAAGAPRAAVSVPRRRSLRIAMLNDLGYAYGAGIAHRRMAQMFVEAGHQVKVLRAATSTPFREAPAVRPGDVLGALKAFRPDLVVVGNIHGSELSAATIGRVCGQYETALILHDLWWLTGRCAYPGGCRQYLRGCDERCTCPAGYPELAAGRIASAWQVKRAVLTSSKAPTLLANSRWTLSRAEEALRRDAGGTVPPMDWIKFGVELDVFRPRDREACRERLGLPRDQFVIMTSASSLGDARKGLPLLAEALQLLDLPDVVVAGVGWYRRGEAPPIPGMRAMGYCEDARELAQLYSAADIFVGPSLEEAFGMVFVEAAACGTPSVGLPVGGVPEAVRDGVSGLIAESADAAGLARAIEALYRDASLRRDLSGWGRLWAENEWSMSAAWNRFVNALRAQGVAERIGLPRKIALDGAGPIPEPEPIVATEPIWRAVEGFGPWEMTRDGGGRCRWVLGPRAVFEIDVAAAGAARLLVACRNVESDQRVRLVHGRRVVGEGQVPVADRRDHVLRFDVRLTRGTNRFELHAWRWRAGPRPMALQVRSIVLVDA